MARGKSLGLVGLVGVLLGILVIIPFVKIYFPGVFAEGFINVRCEKTTCPEGTFCEKAYDGGESCVPIYVGKQ
jgi:hypothetical protein